MSWIWTLPALLTATLAGVFYPVFTRRGGIPLPPGLEGDPGRELATQRDAILVQLKEMEMEAAGQDRDAPALRADLEQELAAILLRLDACVPVSPSAQAQADAVVPRSPVDISIAFSVMLLVGVMTGGLYLFMGTPEEIAPATAAPSHAIPAEFAAMVDQAAQKLQATPDDLEGWMRLARSYVAINRPADAMAAYTHIVTRHPDQVDAAVGLAELQMQSDNPQLQELGVKRFEEVISKQPDRPEALWFLGGAALRSGDRTTALTLWKRLQPQLPPGSSAAKTVEQAIREVEKK